ncbi:synaptotagmin-1 isoform X2 [Cryptomeria japonica]|uniref:synaptotagmin-1 isoform X2 n=1 Tax=Cryptomeria japonica TaxID=3369 RepID=UPI0025ACB190|nr:synaptotagmin-1 isoform X2 [Cryptomeria japonica]
MGCSDKPEVESIAVLAEMSDHLKVKVVRAIDLAFKDPNLTSDPFVLLTLGRDSHKSKTTVKNDDLTPIWNEVFTFSVNNTDSSLLKVSWCSGSVGIVG